MSRQKLKISTTLLIAKVQELGQGNRKSEIW